MKKNIIFICIHNSARSQMAEAYMKYFHGDEFNCYSAGLKQGSLNEIVVEAMKLDGIDISKNKSKTVDIFLESDMVFDYVITVCDESSAERCPYFIGEGRRIHIGFNDPAKLNGSYQYKLKNTLLIRNEIKETIKNIKARFL